MDEANVRQKLYHFLWHDIDQAPITQTDANRCPNCGSITYPPPGRPDILVNPQYVIEVKTLRPDEKSFSFSKIDDKQRKWLNRWVYERNEPGYIFLGVIRKHGKLDYLEHMYLVPWEAWLSMETAVGAYQQSIPLRAGKGYKRELQESNLDILHVLKPFEVVREDGEWQFASQEILESLHARVDGTGPSHDRAEP